MRKHWYETAQPGDRFTDHDDEDDVMTIVRPWDGSTLLAVFEPIPGEVVWHYYQEYELVTGQVTPHHVENMRRAVAKALRAGADVWFDHGGAYWLNPEEGGAALEVFVYELSDKLTPSGHDTPEQAAEALIPDDWAPPGGGA